MEEKEMERRVREEKERNERLERARGKKEELLARLIKKKEIVIVKEGKSTEWIKNKQAKWREYREKESITEEENTELLNKLIMKIPQRMLKNENLNLSTSPPTPPSLQVVLPSLKVVQAGRGTICLLYTSPSPRDS